MTAAAVNAISPGQIEAMDAVEALAAAHRRAAAEMGSLRAENEALRAALAAMAGEGVEGGQDGRWTKDGPRDARAAVKMEVCNEGKSAGGSGRCGLETKEKSAAGGGLSSALMAFPQPVQPGTPPTPRLSAPNSARTTAPVFADGVRCLTAVDESEHTIKFFVHEGVLRKLPYFEVEAARWQTRDASEFHLPSHCPHAAFSAILCRLYATDSRWTPADWITVLGEDISVAYGALLLAKMFLASDLVPEVLAVVQQLASNADNVAWLQGTIKGIELPELQGFHAASDPYALDEEALKQAALSAMKGSAEGRQLFKAILSRRESIGLAGGDAAALFAVLADHASYVSHWCTHGTRDVRHGHARGESMAGAYQVWACDFFKPFAIPAIGFSWLWQIAIERIECQPELYGAAFAVFQSLQWLEYEISANRRGREAPGGSRRLLHVPEAATKQTIRRAYASFLLLGVRLLGRARLEAGAFVEAFTAGTLTSAQAPEGLAGRRRNVLSFQQSGRGSSTYVDDTDLVAAVLSGVEDNVSDLLLGCVPNFRDWQWAFSPAAVRALSDDQQAACTKACSTKWLTGETCNALRGPARAAARLRLAPLLGSLDAQQRAFMWEGL